MLTNRYHISTIIAIFFALGIGLLIGGTLGQTWMLQTENRIVDMAMMKYENQLSLNQLLQKQLVSLQLMNQYNTPLLQDQKIVWVRPYEATNDLLPFLMKFAGAKWEENQDLQSIVSPDIILVSDSETPTFIHPDAKVIYIEPRALQFTEPQEAINFIIYLKNIISKEEQSHAAIGIYYYPSLE